MTQAASYHEFKEQVRAAHNIRDVVARYLPLNPNNTAVCPFHRDTRPSFSVNVKGQYFHCFGCQAGGDVFKFVELIERKTFAEAVELLATWAQIPVYRPLATDLDQEETERATLYLTEILARYYHAALTPEAVHYFTQRRRLPAEFLERFMVGWANGQAWAYVAETYGHGWAERLVLAGLATETRNALSWAGGAVYRDLFYDRLIFPMFSRGQPVFLSGRTLASVEPKYLHQRGREAPLYNEEAVGAEVYVTEGPFDALSLLAWGYPTVALNGGPRPTPIAKLQRAQRVYLCLDADPAGFRETMVLALALWPKAIVVRLPEGLDPSDFYQQRSPAEFADLVGRAVDPVRFGVDQVPKDTPLERLGEALEPVFRLLARVKPLACEGYVREVVAPQFRLDKAGVQRCFQEIARYAGVPVQCPACGTVLTTRVMG